MLHGDHISPESDTEENKTRGRGGIQECTTVAVMAHGDTVGVEDSDVVVTGRVAIPKDPSV